MKEEKDNRKYETSLTISIIMTIVGLILIAYSSYNKGAAANKTIDLTNDIERASFIEKEGDKYKIINNKLSLQDNEDFPELARVSTILKIRPEQTLNYIDHLDEYNLDEQAYIVIKYYESLDDKKLADKYINTLENNINEDKANQKDSLRIYNLNGIGLLGVLLISIAILSLGFASMGYNLKFSE